MVLVVLKTPQLKMQSEVMMSMSMAPKVLQPRQLPPTGMPHLLTHRALTVQLDLVWVRLIPTQKNSGIPSTVDWNQMPSYARPYLFWQRFCIGVDFSPGCNLIWTTFCGSWRAFWDFLSIMFCHNLENNYPGSVSHTLSWRVENMDNLRWVVFITGPSSLGVPGVPWYTQILADQLTLFQPGGTYYAHLITSGTLGFSDLPTALQYKRGEF